MKKFVWLSIAGMACLMVATSADAGILSSLQNKNQIDTNQLNDDSRSIIIDRDADDLISVDDVIFGIFKVTGVQKTVPGSEQDLPDKAGIYGIFSVQVKSVVGSTILHKPVTDASYTLKALLADDLEPSSFSHGGSWATSAVAVLEIADITGVDPFDDTTSAPTTITTAMSGSAGWVLDGILGFGTADDFLRADVAVSATGATAIDTNSDGKLQISELEANDDGFQFLSESAGLSRFHEANDVKILDNGLTSPVSGKLHDVLLKPEGSIQTSPLTNWKFEDDSNFQFVGAPEPTSIVALVGLVVTVGAASRRRRRRK